MTSVKKAPVAVPSRKVILLLVLSVVVLCAGYLVRQGSFGIIPFSMADLSRKKFVSEMEPSAYIQFRDDQNVDIQTEYSRYSGMELGILTGRYTIKQDSHKPEVRIEYMFNGANQVATYAFRITDGGVMYLTGETVEPLPRWLKYNPH
ncbi:MAG: hypothetical protein HYX67_04085 [Candidatus Melainabacteria bacterium]|nr:hypothetical protein [Candidatus Melainabacteria bacterium]